MPIPLNYNGFKLDLLRTSDLMTVLTRSFNDYVYGRSVTVKKSAFAVLVSIISRLFSDNFTKILGGTDTTQSAKNQIVVGVVNAVAAMAMKQSPLRGAMDGVSADLTAEWIMNALGNTIGNPKGTWDFSVLGQ